MKKVTKRKKGNIESLLESLLSETQPVDRPQAISDFEPVDNKQFSLDQAIDRYLVQYERESIPTSEVYESVDRLTSYLFEQDDAPAGDDPGADLGGGLDFGGDDSGGDLSPDAGDEKPAEDGEKPVMNTPQINLQDFARSVARLVNNINSLMDLQTLILNRSEKYIQSNYDEKTAREFMTILSDSYDLRPVASENLSMNPSEFPEPHTGVTGPVGG